MVPAASRGCKTQCALGPNQACADIARQNRGAREWTDQNAVHASVEHNKAVSRRWIEVFNARDDAAEADVRAQDYVAYTPASLEPSPLDSEAWTRFLADFVKAFPDLHLTVEDAVGEGDLVAQRIHFAVSSTAESRSTGSRWTPSRCSSSWV
jgi:predicted ester cyclase